MTIKTNRELYKEIEKLLKEKEKSELPTLEEYLISLYLTGTKRQTEKNLSLDDFYSMLLSAFTPPENNNYSYTYQKNENIELQEGYAGWESVIRRQIYDLQLMNKSGQLNDILRYLGIRSPGRHYWVNFDPLTYIECGIMGSLGGWEPGDDTGREYVQGKVVTVNQDGEFVECDPQNIPAITEEIPCISWNKFKEFLSCGQNYE